MNGILERGIDKVDELEVLTFIDTIFDSECGLKVREPLSRSIHQFFERYNPEKCHFVALYREADLKAILAVDHLKESTAILKWIFVAPEDRGNGIGSRLMDRAIDFARGRGYQKLILCTMTRMAAARHLYQKKGFEFKQRVTFWRKPMQVYENDLIAAQKAASVAL